MLHNGAMNDSAPKTARARARAELTAAITDTAREHLARDGANGLSLRAVARDLGMVSSALYRYFPSRDALLTQLIIDAYESMGQSCAAAHDACERDDLAGRWRAVAHGIRTWALAHPHEYGLIYGTPVPDYDAPEETLASATIVSRLLLGIVAQLDPERVSVAPPHPVPDGLRQQLDQMIGVPDSGVHLPTFLVGISAWATLFGLVSFEVFGRFDNLFGNADELYTYQVELYVSMLIGTPPT